MNNMALVVDERMKEVDQIINCLNFVDEEAIKALDFPNKDECVLLVLYVK